MSTSYLSWRIKKGIFSSHFFHILSPSSNSLDLPHPVLLSLILLHFLTHVQFEGKSVNKWWEGSWKSFEILRSQKYWECFVQLAGLLSFCGSIGIYIYTRQNKRFHICVNNKIDTGARISCRIWTWLTEITVIKSVYNNYFRYQFHFVQLSSVCLELCHLGNCSTTYDNF